MMPAWSDTDFGNDQLYNVYAAMNEAREESDAIQTNNRWFLNGDSNNGNIFSVAKYEEANEPANLQDVMLCFVNLDRNSNQSDNFKIPSGLAALIGLDDVRLYNVVNIAAYERPPAVTGRRSTFLWGTPKTGSELKNTGFTVFLSKVPTTSGAWDTAPYEAQYQKLVDVTDPLEVEIGSPE